MLDRTRKSLEETEIESRRLVFFIQLEIYRGSDAPSTRLEDIGSSRGLSLIWRGARSIWKDGFDAFLADFSIPSRRVSIFPSTGTVTRVQNQGQRRRKTEMLQISRGKIQGICNICRRFASKCIIISRINPLTRSDLRKINFSSFPFFLVEQKS